MNANFTVQDYNWCYKMKLLTTLFCMYLVTAASAASNGFGRKKEFIAILKDDLPYIRCQMCELTAKHIHRTVKQMRAELADWDRMTELAIFDKLEFMCDTSKENEGGWISKLDIVEEGDRLRVVQMSSMSDCQRECTTLAKACSDLIVEHDMDLAEALYKSVSVLELNNMLCRDLSGVCKKETKPFVGPRKGGETFKAMDADALRMKRLMEDMKSQGMSGNVISRDSIIEDYREEMEDAGYDVDAQIASKLGQVRSSAPDKSEL